MSELVPASAAPRATGTFTDRPHRAAASIPWLNQAVETVDAILDGVLKNHALEDIQARRTLFSAPFGEPYLKQNLLHLSNSKAVQELAGNGEVSCLVFTSEEARIERYPSWLRIVRLGSIEHWPCGNVYANRFVKWAVPLLFRNIQASIYWSFRNRCGFPLCWVNTHSPDLYRLGMARNLGILESRSEVVVLLDDDSHPCEVLVEEYKKTVRPRTLTAGFRAALDENDQLHQALRRLRIYHYRRCSLC